MEYKRIPGYKAEISADGRSVRSLITGNELKIGLDKRYNLPMVHLVRDIGGRTSITLYSAYRRAWNFELPFGSRII